MKVLFFLMNIFMLSLVFCSQIFAAEYGYHEGLSLRLGGGLDPADLTESRQECVQFDAESRVDGSGSRGTSFDLTMIESKKDLYSKLGFSAEASAQAFFAKGNAKASYLDQFEFHEDSINFAIIGRVDYGRVQMKNPRLKPEFKKVIEEGSHVSFSWSCGTHFVTEETRGASVIAMFSIRKSSEKHKRQFGVESDISGSFGPFGGKLKTRLESLMAEAAQGTQINIKVFAVGGGGIVELQDLAREANDIDGINTEVKKIREVLAKYIATMKIENSVPTSFKVTPMQVLGWKDASNWNYVARDNALTEYFFLVDDLVKKKKRLQEILTDRDTEKYLHLSPKTISRVEAQAAKISEDVSRLTKEALDCFHNADKCHLPVYIGQSIIWPVTRDELNGLSRIAHIKQVSIGNPEWDEFSEAECSKAQRNAFRRGCISFDEFRAFYSLNVAPACNQEGKYGAALSCE